MKTYTEAIGMRADKNILTKSATMWYLCNGIFHCELEYFFLFGSILYREATPPAEKDPVTFNH